MKGEGSNDIESGQGVLTTNVRGAGSVYHIGGLPGRSVEEYGHLPYFGPPDPTRCPIHKKLFLGGLLFPPLWIVGAFLPVRDALDNWAELFRFRCQAMAMVIFVIGCALLVLETAFRGA